MSLDPLRNPKDPLHRSGPEGERELFRRMSDACDGYTLELAVGAAANVLVNAIRQQHAQRRGAQEALEQLVARMRTLLLEQHYDGLGNRRNVFPFHQTIEVPPLSELLRRH